ncbi:MAG: nucleotide-binding protein [Actinobacteria bacterium]|nr:nucleotide-binding protein [Actinomycetota bacterium]
MSENDLGATLGFSKADSDSIGQYLVESGFAEYQGLGGRMSITHEGVVAAEALIEKGGVPLPAETRAKKAISTIDSQLAELTGIVAQANQGGDYRLAFERMARWKARTVQLLSETVSTREGQQLQAQKRTTFNYVKPISDVSKEANMYSSVLLSLKEELEHHPDSVLPLEQQMPEEVIHKEPASARSRLVFVVHGHDEFNTLKLRNLLKDQWSLDSVKLDLKAAKGRTLIEKFEQEAETATFAIILMTPDDLVKTDKGEYAQARPNVIFELGWFCGRLGRDRVLILLKDGTELHSDLAGINYAGFSKDVNEAVLDIQRELKAAGLL